MNRSTLLVCERCDTVHTWTRAASSETPHCIRCAATLYRAHPLRVNTMLALTTTGLIALAVANAYPIVALDAHGQHRAATLMQAVFAAADHGSLVVAVVCAITAFTLPLLELLLYAWVLAPFRRGHASPGFAAAMRVLSAIRAWSMLEVFMLAVIIAAVKLGSIAVVTPEIGVFAFAIVTVVLSALRLFDLRDLWAHAEALSR